MHFYEYSRFLIEHYTILVQLMSNYLQYNETTEWLLEHNILTELDYEQIAKFSNIEEAEAWDDVEQAKIMVDYINICLHGEESFVRRDEIIRQFINSIELDRERYHLLEALDFYI